MRHSTLLSLAAALPAAHGVAFAGPEPTEASPDQVLGFSPMPTKAPSMSELLKRQSNALYPLCGWIDGDFDSAITCNAGRTCMFYKSASIAMAGCCPGSDRQNCAWATSCVDYSRYTAGSCGSNCLVNPFVRKCSGAAEPYCITYTYPSDGVTQYDCDSVSGRHTMRLSATYSGISTSIRLTTVAAAQVTGFNAATSDTTGSATSTKKATRLAIGGIIGIVVAVLALLFFIIIGVVICLKRKKKAKQLAANAQIVAANQANGQSQYQPPNGVHTQPMAPQQPMQQPMQPMPPMQNTFSPPMPSQSPQPGSFPPPEAQKYAPTANVHEIAMSPISNPSTPAPTYAQPYGAPPNANVPPMPQQQHHELQHMPSPVSRYASPVAGAHEVDASSVPHVPHVQGGGGNGQAQGPVYEMGQGR